MDRGPGIAESIGCKGHVTAPGARDRFSLKPGHGLPPRHSSLQAEAQVATATVGHWHTTELLVPVPCVTLARR